MKRMNQTDRRDVLHIRLLPAAGALALVLAAGSASAQHAGHGAASKHKPATSSGTKATAPKPKPKTQQQPSGHQHGAAASQSTDDSGMDHSGMDHSGMDHSGMDHSGMDHSGMDHSGMDHSGMDHSGMDHSGMDHSGMDHSGMDHSGMDHPAASAVPREPIPPLTEADRRAAFPDVAGHTVHDNGIHSYWLMDRLEAWDAEHGTGLEWEGVAWIGTDTDRLWLRSEGEREGGSLESADVEVLYGRGIARWWDLVAGVRHDFAPGASQSFVAVGVMGLAPQKFEVEATGYVSERGKASARLEVEYELLLTNRLILQPLVEVEFQASDDPARGIGSGLSIVEAGLRLRYEFHRQFAPYVGVVHERAFGDTADFRRAGGEDVEDTRIVAGVRFWF
jgi:copper resistance protein B